MTPHQAQPFSHVVQFDADKLWLDCGHVVKRLESKNPLQHLYTPKAAQCVKCAGVQEKGVRVVSYNPLDCLHVVPPKPKWTKLSGDPNSPVFIGSGYVGLACCSSINTGVFFVGHRHNQSDLEFFNYSSYLKEWGPIEVDHSIYGNPSEALAAAVE